MGVLAAHTSAPATRVAGDVLLSGTAFANGTNNSQGAQLASPVYVPAGKGVYFIVDTASESVGFRSALYTLL